MPTIDKIKLIEKTVLGKLSLETRELCASIRLMAFDVDGILTDGKLYYGSSGEAIKRFDVLDGQGLRLLMKKRIKVALITGRLNPIAAYYASEIGVDFFSQAIRDKKLELERIAKETGIAIKETGFMGDDIIDLPVMKITGFAASVPSSPSYISKFSHWISSKPGGNGAVRECCDILLAAKGHLEKFL